MKEYEKLETSWHIDLCLNVIIKLTDKSIPFISPYPLGLSHRYRCCCTFIASTFWSRGKECTICYYSSISCSGIALDAGS